MGNRPTMQETATTSILPTLESLDSTSIDDSQVYVFIAPAINAGPSGHMEIFKCVFSQTILDLKKLVENRTGMSLKDQQNLQLAKGNGCGVVLADDALLKDCGIFHVGSDNQFRLSLTF
jgi:hypothetical protein